MIILLFTEEIREAKQALYNPNLFQGDIHLSEKQTGLNGIVNDTDRWPGGVIPFVIDESLGKWWRDVEKSELSEWINEQMWFKLIKRVW